MSLKKIRADELIAKKKLTASRSKAQAMIMAGSVDFRVPLKAGGFSAWDKVKKAGQLLPELTEFQIDDPQLHDVGRGAVKLRGALDHWKEISIRGLQALDIGSSTGGFTQVLLERGALGVLAMDVGTHQLHERLRADPRVTVLEQQHVLKMTPQVWDDVGKKPPFDVMVTDLSFISLIKVVPTASEWLGPNGNWILLVKPQFEVGPKKAPGGIVQKEEYRQEAIDGVRACVDNVEGLIWKDIIPSPISGGDGNKEFLLWLRKKR